MQDCFICAPARSIVTEHINDKDTRRIYKKIKNYFAKSMAADTRIGTLSTYLTSTRLANTRWRGSQVNFILHWKEQARIYNELAGTEAYSESQLVRFLNNTVNGVKNLEQVLTVNKTARKGAGNNTPLSFPDFVQLLMDAAQAHDAANGVKGNPSICQEVNVHEVNEHEMIEFDDGTTEQFDPYEIHAHDLDTPVEELSIFQTNFSPSGRKPSNGPRRVLLNSETWRALDKADQSNWDLLTDKAKGIILRYASQRGRSNPTLGTGTRSTANRSVNQHELVFDDDPPGAGTDNTDAQGEFEVSTHQFEATNNLDHSVNT